ncbi:outer membrane protein assembly factor BamA [Pontibacter sp. E15-1]|uniref:outer membrane protein assembly factor BamA n=1 Tax=Pontibacter sp. E15-1 TaxID=2919918 RepID=UPI001F4FBBD3|nr:outer membrane protein assembly factor BamA [Pontibacter sp. E15-1]MCJ8164746.1 outer membrane protein assembly factor BamA [Pontibacter sp. E15-1]
MTRCIWVLVLLLLSAGAASSQVLNKPAQGAVDYAQPKQYRIGGISVTGAKFLEPMALISVIGLKEGDEITVPGEDISRAIQKLWQQGILGDVEVFARPEGGLIFLTFDLKERPRLSDFRFSGINKTQSDALRTKVPLQRGRIVTDAVLNSTRNVIRNYYLEKSYLNAKINITQRPDSTLPNSVVLNIHVDKGNKVKIAEIEFVGNEAFADKKLKKQLKKTKEKKIYKIFTSSKFNQTEYDADKQHLLDFYSKEGYRDATIVSDSVYRISDDRLGVRITVDEGRRYYFRNITWEGNYLYEDAYLSRVLGITKGDVYNQQELDKRLNYNPTGGVDVSALYQNDGYLFSRIEPVEVHVEGDSIDLEMRVTEGPQATINKITVTGNDKTSDHVILREIRTLPGQKYSRDDLIRTRNELAALGYFDPETIGLNPIPNEADGTVDINYSVVERPNDQISLSGGWGGVLGAVGTVGLTLNNFSTRKMLDLSEWRPVPTGDGQRLSLNIQANGRLYQSYSLSFTEPWLGGRKANSLTVSLFKTVRRFSLSTDANAQSLNVDGASISLGRRLNWPDNFFFMNHSLSYNRYNLNNFPLAEGFSDGVSNSVSFTNTLGRSSIDNPTFPRRGSSFTLSLNVTPPYSLLSDRKDQFEYIEFNKWMFDASYFLNLAGNLVLNTRAHFGFLGTYSNNTTVGPFERFKLGGTGLGGGNYFVGTEYVGLRGYEEAKVVNSTDSYLNSAGGIAYNKFVFEARQLISPNPAATIYGLAFLEAGNNYGSFDQYNPFKLYRSAGVGARIFMSAFGLLGFDYAWRLDTLPGGLDDKRGMFHFVIGQQIR